VLFAEVDPADGSYWQALTRDHADGFKESVEFRWRIPKTGKGRLVTPQQVANAAAGEMNEARGLAIVIEVLDGMPTFTAVYVANGSQVFCIRSSDHAREIPIVLPIRAPWSGGGETNRVAPDLQPEVDLCANMRRELTRAG